jgi:hypothetical protein
MKTTLNQNLILSLKIDAKPLKFAAGKVAKSEPNPTLTPYIVYDDHKDAPTGFGVKVAGTKTTYIIQKKVQGRVIKAKVGNLSDYSLGDAREAARKHIQIAIETGRNPNAVAKEQALEEITLGKCFDEYFHFLKTRAKPATDNTIKSFEKNRRKFANWEDKKVRELKSKEIIERFDTLAVGAR